MSDFISNDPNGKSDLYTKNQPPIPADQPKPDETPQASTCEADPAVVSHTQEFRQNAEYTSSNASEPAGSGSTGNGTYTLYQPPHQNPYGAGYEPPYGPYGYGYQPPTPPPQNGFNTAALVLGIVTWAGLILCCGCISPITAVLSIVFACMGRDQKRFDGKALVGMVMSIVFLVLFLMLILFLMVIAAFGAMESPDLYEEGAEQLSRLIRR